MATIYTQLAEILEVDNVENQNVLSEFENWDSLTVLSILAMLDAQFAVNLTSEELRRMATIGDLVGVVENRRKK